MFDYNNPERIIPMLAAEGGEELFKDVLYIAQRKYNGTRGITIRNGENISIMGRSWKNDFAERFPEIVSELLTMSPTSFVIDGEIVFYMKGTMEEQFLTALATEETKTKYDVRYHVFDVLHVASYDVRNLPFHERQEILALMYKKNPNNEPRVVAKTFNWAGEEQKRELWKTTLAMGGEGIMFKDINSTYQESRGLGWFKYKPFKSADCVVVGYTEGKGVRSETFGALLLGQYDDKGLLHYVGKTSGMSDEELYSFVNRFESIKIDGKSLNLANADFSGTVANSWHWIRPEIVVEVHYLMRTSDNKFQFPRFEQERLDKSPEECIMYEK